jgi:chromosome segregation ATPase
MDSGTPLRTDVLHTPGGNFDEFQKANRELITSLQKDNKSLRLELSDKEKELKTMTDELSRVINGSGSQQVSEQFLIASLQSARESISSLDSANQELLDALSARQEEIMRLSSAGMGLQTRFQKQTERMQQLEIENSNMGKAIDELLQKESSTSQDAITSLTKAQADLQRTIDEFNAFKLTCSGHTKKISELEEANAKLRSELIDSRHNSEMLQKDLNQALKDSSSKGEGADSLRAQLDALTKELKEKTELLEEQANNLDEQEEVSTALESELAVLKVEKDKVLADLARANSDVKTLQDRCDTQSEQIKQFEAMIAALRDELSSSKHDSEMLRKEILHLQSNLDNAGQSTAATSDNLKAASAKITELEREVKDLRAALSKAKDDMTAAAAEQALKLASSQADFQKLSTEIASLKHDLGLKTSELKFKAEEAEKLAKSLEDSRKLVSDRDASLVELKITIEKLRVEIDKFKAEISRLEQLQKANESNHFVSKEAMSASIAAPITNTSAFSSFTPSLTCST